MTKLYQPEGKFTIVPNAALKSTALSLKAKGMLCLLLSYKDGWEYSFDELSKHLCEGREATQGALRELTQQGYLIRKPRRKEDNTGFEGWDWYIYGEPQTNGFPVSQDSRQSENPADNNKTETTNNTKSIYSEPETLVGPNPSEEREKVRQQAVVSSSVKKQAKDKLYGLLGHDHFPKAQWLMRDTGVAPEKLVSTLLGKPKQKDDLCRLKEEDYAEVMAEARKRAAKHSTGWETMAWVQFFVVLGESFGRTKGKPVAQARFELETALASCSDKLQAIRVVEEHLIANPGLDKQEWREYVEGMFG